LRKVGLHRREGWLGISVSARDLFGAHERERLQSGFVSRVVVRIELWRDGAKEPVARQDRSSEILFDLWDEMFLVRVVERRGPKEQRVATAQDAVEAATAFYAFQVAELAGLDPRATYRFRVRADLNPLSPDLVNDVRRWLVRTPGQGRSATGDSAFGSFVSIFVNPRIQESERQVAFVSQPFFLAAP
jgi:hypothetical protein